MMSHDQEMAAREKVEKIVREVVEAHRSRQHVASKKVHVTDVLYASIATAVVDALLDP